MVRITEAIYSEGVLRPTTPLDLQNEQRVRIIIQAVDEPRDVTRIAALDRLQVLSAQSGLRLHRPLPARDELHDRTYA